MGRGVLLRLLLVASSVPLVYTQEDEVQGACGLMEQGGMHFWWFNDLDNRINHAAHLTIVEYGGVGHGIFDHAFFHARRFKPTQRIGTLVMWHLGGTVVPQSTTCTVRSDAVSSTGYGGQCGAMGFQQRLTPFPLKGSVIAQYGALSAVGYSSIEDCCTRCTESSGTSVASSARRLTTRGLQAQTCGSLGFSETADAYLSGGSDTAWASPTPVHSSDTDCCQACADAPGCAGFSVYRGSCYLTLGQYVETGYTGARAFKRFVSTAAGTSVSSPPPPSVGIVTSNAFARSAGKELAATATLYSGSAATFTVSITGTTSLATCAEACVDRLSIGNVQFVTQILHYVYVNSAFRLSAPVQANLFPSIRVSHDVDHVRCYCYASDPRANAPLVYPEYTTDYMLMHYELSNRPPSPPPPPLPPPAVAPPSTACVGFVVSGSTCTLYTERETNTLGASVQGASVWYLQPSPPPPHQAPHAR